MELGWDMESLIKIIHFLLVAFVVIAPFTGSKTLININIVILGYMSLRWISGYEKCGFTELEYLVSGKPYGQGFLYRLLNGVTKMQENKFNVFIISITVLWLIVNIIIGSQIQ